MDKAIYILILASIVLGLIEIFVVPGFGVLGVTSGVCLAIAVYLTSREHGVLIAAGVLFFCLILFGASFWLFFRSPASEWLVLKRTLENAKVPQAPQIPSGTKGISLTALRPSGKVVFMINSQEQIFEASTRGEFLESDRQVVVVRQQGNHLIVAADL